MQSFGRPAFRHFVSVACGREVSEPPRDVATQTSREFVVESPPRDSEDIEVTSDDERRKGAEMMLRVDEDIAGPSGSGAVVSEAGASVVDSSEQPVAVVGSRSVRAGILNSFIDNVIHRSANYMYFS